MADVEQPDLKTQIDEQAKSPSLDEFFSRVPPLSREELLAMRSKLRNERASWGGGR
jgi:hypothetical protein